MGQNLKKSYKDFFKYTFLGLSRAHFSIATITRNVNGHIPKNQP